MILYDQCPACAHGDIAPLFPVTDYTVSRESFVIWECAHCTLRFTQGVPGESDIGPYYRSDSYISHTDTSKGLINRVYHRVRRHTLAQKKKLVVSVTGKRTGALLDLGAGTGAFLGAMQEAGWKVTGLEPDPAAREKASSLYGLHLGDTEELFSLPEHSMDAVTLWHVLEHVHRLHACLDRLRSVLVPGGRLLLAVPNYRSYDQEVYGPFWAAYDVPRHLYHFSPAAMKTLLASHGLTVLAMRPMWYDSFYVSMLSEKYKTGRSHYLRAWYNGAVSNWKAIRDTGKCSSVIYVVARDTGVPAPGLTASS